MLIAQITDLHGMEEGRLAMGAVDTNGDLERAVTRLNALTPPADLVIVTGDLVNDGRPAQYAAVTRRLAALTAPLLVLPGNHDDRTALRTAFADHRYLPADGGLLNYVVDDYPVRVVALDTMVPGQSGGAVGEAHLCWLDARLAEAPDRPTVIAMHHPPFETGIVFMDRIGCAGGAALAAVVARHPQVERVICGHVHRPVQTRFGGTIASIAPSVAHQIPLVLDMPDFADAWVREPAGFALLKWTGDRLVGHLGYVDAYGGPTAY